ncbi:MAG: glutamine-synthetase adenylyltransferase [Rhodobacterales bacterium]|nr:glutamine-synthetase adenylyltransferase [Rhodobacterales bacterium]
MSPTSGLSSRLRRLPLAHDPGAAADMRRTLPAFAPEIMDLLATTASCSPYLRALMLREAAWLPQAVSAPEAALEDTLSALGAVALEALPDALRKAKRRVALLVALCDLGGVWPLETVTGALTRLADRAVQLALTGLVADEVRRGRLTGAAPEDATTAAGMVVLAMGKMGAGELNYSSDIDLICLFDETRYRGVEQDARASFIKVVRRMTAILSDVTDGYVFRCDLRLRPDASVTPVCLSMAAAEAYYEAEGRTWERAAYIKARPCAGDLGAGMRFLKTLTPFVWRKHLDFAAIQDAHDMRLRIRDHRGLHGRIAVEGHNLKLGAGGIREIEFFTQTRQLIAGGRDPELRDPTTVGGLAALGTKGWVPVDVASDLTDLYRAHREVEHRLQMVNDAQTHSLPVTREGVARIAALCGQTEADFRRDLLDRLNRTDQLTEGFFSPARTEPAPELSDTARAITRRWESYPALRSDRAQAIFRRLRPRMLHELSRAAHPDEALVALDGFLAGLPAGVQIFSLFEANPTLIELIVDIAGSAPALAQHLARNAAVLDGVIGGSFWGQWPGMDGLRRDLAARLDEAADYETRLNTARRWMKEWHFRVGVHHLRGLIDGTEAGVQYSNLAEAVVVAIWETVTLDFAGKHGPAPGRGAVVVAMGSLGAGRLNAGSDLDLIVIYDAAGIEGSAGPRPLAARPYYARLTQALVTALTAQMPEGRLYEVDMRLRPSGRQGPVATSLDSFTAYQRTEAWTWEHLALTRARVLAGSPLLGQQVETFRRALLGEKGKGPAVRADMASMRSRLQAAKPEAGVWDARNGPGRLLDIELAAETVALLSASAAQGVEAQIAAGTGRIVPDSDAQALISGYRLMWRLQAATRLLTEGVLDMATMGEGARAFVLRETGMVDSGALAAALATSAASAEAAIGRLTGEATDGETSDGSG